VYYFSRNAQLDASDASLGSRAVPALASGATDSATISLTLPDPIDAGSYWVFAKSDGTNAVSENSETNNTRTISIAVGPDLVISTLTAPATAAAGGSIVVTDTTANQGAGGAAASTTRFYLSTNLALDASDTPLQTRSVPELAAGATSSGSTTIVIPGATTPGTYYVFAQADGAGAVPEPTENNNTRSAAVRVGPDLTIFNLVSPTRAASAGSLAVTDTIKNSGAGAAPSSSTAFYLSTNISLDASDIRLPVQRTVPALAPNEVSTGTTTMPLPQLTPGTWYLVANADDGNNVAETQESNNIRFATLSVGPDLTISSISAPGSAAGGTAITVTAGVRNAGAEAAPATVVRCYLSSNAVLDASDPLLNAERMVPPLAPDGVSTGSIALPIPPGMAGTFYLFVVADGAQQAVEANEQNNTGARLIQITP
jgi:subtilase family serine protease